MFDLRPLQSWGEGGGRGGGVWWVALGGPGALGGGGGAGHQGGRLEGVPASRRLPGEDVHWGGLIGQSSSKAGIWRLMKNWTPSSGGSGEA